MMFFFLLKGVNDVISGVWVERPKFPKRLMLMRLGWGFSAFFFIVLAVTYSITARHVSPLSLPQHPPFPFIFLLKDLGKKNKEDTWATCEAPILSKRGWCMINYLIFNDLIITMPLLSSNLGMLRMFGSRPFLFTVLYLL